VDTLPEYTFDFVAADATRDSMGSITRNISTVLHDLDAQVQTTLQNWTSDAREAYNASKAKWDQAAAMMPQALARADATLVQISDGYLQAEYSGVNAFQSG
jgi:WXG100 family type VII secretion target